MICPNCQTEVEVTEQHYGALYTCNSCQAVYFINFEGQPEYGDVSTEIPADLNLGEASSTVTEPAKLEASPTQDFNSTNSNNGDGFEASLEPLVDSVDMVAFDSKLDEQFGSMGNNDFNNQLNNEFSSPIDNSFQALTQDNNQQTDSFGAPSSDMPNVGELAQPEVDFSNTDANPFEAVVDTQAPPPTQAPNKAANKSFTDVAQEISAFGNTEVQLAGLNYDLKIVGLDTQETTKLFKEAIEDSKFGWDANELMKTIKNGEIQFTRLSPVKAYILAKRLQFLDIEKHWKQNVLS